MPQIYELYGYPLSDRSEKAEQNRQIAHCPFMDKKCDGGGNRHLSNIALKDVPALQHYFRLQLDEIVASGVCSIQVNEESPAWIVCPHRLLYLGNKNPRQADLYQAIMQYSGYPSTTRLGVWSEVKIKYRDDADEMEKSFDYTFDYILMPLQTLGVDTLENLLELPQKTILNQVQKAGYQIETLHDRTLIHNFPTGYPIIVEIMTSSTSGGNQFKRTTIPLAFEDALLGKEHHAPSINYRQVWARMVSQLIVKSEVGLNWGGKTFWIVQDNLIDYISKSTALNIYALQAETTSEVNLLSLNPAQTITLYSGPIQPQMTTHTASFQDIIRAASLPKLALLIKTLANHTPSHIFQA